MAFKLSKQQFWVMLLLPSNMLYIVAEPSNIWTVNIILPKPYSVVAKLLSPHVASQLGIQGAQLWLKFWKITRSMVEIWFSSLEASLLKLKKRKKKKQQQKIPDYIWHTTPSQEVNFLNTFTSRQSSITGLDGTKYGLSQALGLTLPP